MWNKLNEKKSCTQEKCSWIIPSGVPCIEYKEVKDINFKSARFLKEQINQQIDNDSYNDSQDEDLQMPSSISNLCPPSINILPSELELQTFFDQLSESKEKPAILSLIKKHSALFIPPSAKVKKITDLFCKDLLDCSYLDLLTICENTNINITEDEIILVENDTRCQAKGSSFYLHRAGRIGASLCCAASQTNPSQPAPSLIKTICYPKLFSFSTPATKHGNKYEKMAIDAFVNYMSREHRGFKAVNCGLFINKDYPFLHATPDFLYS